MEFLNGETVTRLRRKLIVDPYNPESTTQGSWDDADSIELEDAFVASSSSVAPTDATRKQILTTKSLYLTDPEADVTVGDRIVSGGGKYSVDVIPAADTNPFTGWRPAVEIPLERADG